MGIVLLRVDERLIHGQVVVGWGATLHPDRIVVIDDELADSAWEQELYTLGLPEEVGAEFHSVIEGRLRLEAWRNGTSRTVVLTRTIDVMRRLAEGGMLRGAEINIGGLHHAPGRRQVLPYVFLSEDERAALQTLADGGVEVSARDVPGARRINLAHLLGDDAA
jgi:mannose/fructose/N-acetylgalactosamine-specific phosphotransferase system component IIB